MRKKVGFIMKQDDLLDIKEQLLLIPMLTKRVDELARSLKEAEANYDKMVHSYEEESMDVRKLEENSLSALLFKFIGKYEDKLEKEYKEQIDAKLKLDEAKVRVFELKQDIEDTNKRLIELTINKRNYERELKDRERKIESELNSEAYKKYSELTKGIEYQKKQILEIREAITAANRAKGIADSARGHLDSADDLATYDIWFKGGMLSHMAKYDHIDEAENYMNRLSSQLKVLHKELTDIQINDNIGISQISSGERIMDYWFDNIFTDLNVRGKIRSNMEELMRISSKIDSIIRQLEQRLNEGNQEIKKLEHMKENVLISVY